MAYGQHESVADYLTACLVWLQSGGKLDLNKLASQLKVTKIADLTMARVYPNPPPPKSPPPSGLKPRPLPDRPLPRQAPGERACQCSAWHLFRAVAVLVHSSASVA